jgi:hypothetical protein
MNVYLKMEFLQHILQEQKKKQKKNYLFRIEYGVNGVTVRGVMQMHLDKKLEQKHVIVIIQILLMDELNVHVKI